MVHSFLNFIKPLPSGSYAEGEAESLEEPEVMEDTKENRSSRHNRMAVHRNSQRLWQQLQDLHRSELVRVPALGGGSGHKVPLLTGKLPKN